MRIKLLFNSLGALALFVLIVNNIFYDSIKNNKNFLKEKFKNYIYQPDTSVPNFNSTLEDNDALNIIKKSFFKRDFCGLMPRNLLGNFTIKTASTSFNNSFTFNISSIINEKDYDFMKNLKVGGSYEPPDCKPRHRLAFVIPYRNRLHNLNQFLLNMHPFLQRQELGYTIFVVEQTGDQLFNKGILMNTAFKEIKKNYDNQFECILFHDIDLIPSGRHLISQ